MAPPDLKKMIQIKIKPRKDPYTDQFSRILMVKMLLMTAGVTGISWAKDKVTCIVPKVHDTTGAFVAKSCWINGLYIYRDLAPKLSSFYYGIPTDITLDGVNKYGELCDSTDPRQSSCKSMDKTFFLQYQWFPLGVAALAFIYYLPYMLFCVVNSDMQEIKDMVKRKKQDEVKYDELLSKYFSRKNNSDSNSTARIFLNLIVKMLYVVANTVGMITVDSALNGEFMSFGHEWAKWLSLSEAKRHDYTIPRSPKAGHALLPGFGLCQVTTSGQDIKHIVTNTHTFVCELSQHVLYQYILIIMWYMFIFGICVSLFGLLKHIYSQMAMMYCLGVQGKDVEQVYARLTPRERQYMDLIRRKNLPVFGEVLRKLMIMKNMTGRNDSDSDGASSYDRPYEEKEKLMES